MVPQLIALLLTAAAAWVPESNPRPEELSEAGRWAAAKFEGRQERPQPLAAITVLANNDPVQRNARAGKPMRIGEAQYTRGLYCHANSHLASADWPRPSRGQRIDQIQQMHDHPLGC